MSHSSRLSNSGMIFGSAALLAVKWMRTAPAIEGAWIETNGQTNRQSVVQLDRLSGDPKNLFILSCATFYPTKHVRFICRPYVSIAKVKSDFGSASFF